MRFINKLLATFTIVGCSISYASPWYTGPLLAPAGRTVPAGHTNSELYASYINFPNAFNSDWHRIPVTAGYSEQYSLTFSHGLTKWMDFQFNFPYIYNVNLNHSYQGVGDMVTGLGLQVLRQAERSWKPNLRFVIQEVIPTGRFEQLSPSLNGTDLTGSGTYQTAFNLNFQDSSQPMIDHYIRTRFSIGYTLPSSARAFGANSFGGVRHTNGIIHPGDTLSVDLASEIALSQHWVAVVEGLWTSTQPSNFTGRTGRTPEGLPILFSPRAYNAALSFAPAIEYNFTENVGVIGGSWFTATGKNTLDFQTATVAINVYW